jgi:uncharacterized C2H2 Zn-finger protein
MQKQLQPPKNLHDGFKKTILDETYEVRTGWFGYMQFDDEDGWKPEVQWTHCRDIFQDISDYSIEEKGMWFCCRPENIENVCVFIDRVEKKINIKNRSVFKRTPYPNVLWIQPSLFWINDYIRRSFFTLCLRCGMQYRRSKDNFDHAMYEHYEISKQTKPAIKRFLSGYTFYTYEDPDKITHGWKYLFKGVSGIKLKKLLIY